MKRLVRIYAQRHGDKCGDALTEKGVSQIGESRFHGALAGIEFVSHYASPKNRTQQTAAIVAGGADNVQVNYGLYVPLSDARADAIWGVAGKSSPATVGEWFVALPNGWGPRMREQLQTAFGEMALEASAGLSGEGTVNVYAAGHNLILELALPDEHQNMPPMGLADVIVFTLRVEDDAYSLVSAEHIPFVSH